MVSPFIYVVLGLIPAVTSAHTGNAARSINPFNKTFVHSQHGASKSVRDVDWQPDIAKCPSQCAVLENAFGTCRTSQCLCTDAVAAGYRDCMVCSLDLENLSGMIPDAQQSMDDFTTNCESDGYPVSQITVTVDGTGSDTPIPGQTATAIAAPPPGQTSVAFASPAWPSSTMVIYPWQPTPTTVTQSGGIVWYGGSSFGASFGTTSYASGTNSPVGAGSTTVGGFQIGSQSLASASNTPAPLADNSASNFGASPNATNTSLNPQETNKNGAGASRAISVLSLAAALSATAFSYVCLL